jgi:hypothetical protein
MYVLILKYSFLSIYTRQIYFIKIYNSFSNFKQFKIWVRSTLWPVGHDQGLGHDPMTNFLVTTKNNLVMVYLNLVMPKKKTGHA